MFDREFDISALISIYQKGEMDSNSRQKLDAWLAEDPVNQILLDELMQENKVQSKFAKFRAIDEAKGWQRVKDGIAEGALVKNHAKTVRIWPRITMAAAIALVIFSVGLFYYTGKNKGFSHGAYRNDVPPGKTGATLTLANGKKISLTDAGKGELANEAGISISKTAEGQVVYEVRVSKSDSNHINTLTTAKGETYILTLPDKSTVWMNAASSLTYSAALLERGVRRVKLEGEAYFQIAKDKAHPFIVESGDQQVQVLGTHFNVRAYRSEKIFRTTLLEGSVKVSEDGKTKVLSPGFEAINKSGEIIVEKADTEWAVAWKNNKFIFDSQRIEDIMPMIERWYNVEVIYTGEIPSDAFWGSVSRYDNISKVLGALESTGNVHFKIEGRKIYVSR